MALEALLTFFGILVAIWAIVRPVQRRSLELFAPAWRLIAAIILSFVFIVWRDAPYGVSPPFGWSLPKVMFGLTVAAFLVPVLAAWWGWASWDRARLTDKRIRQVENIFRVALREREFDEVERIVLNNRERLERLPASATSVLFDPAMVAALMDSRSFIHLELLADMQFLNSNALSNRLGAVQAVVREVLRSEPSPIRSAVVNKYGGVEHLRYTDSERELIERTFQNPEWYLAANARYPLVMSAVESLRSGERDIVYNEVGLDYEANQGTSARSRCPIYLTIKTEVLAIQSALKMSVEGDFYVTDLWDVFRLVQERSTFKAAVWESPLANFEHPTPFAYLLHDISADLEDLSGEAVVAACKAAPEHARPPGQVAQALALTWSFCVWSIADSESQVSTEFRNRILRQYLVFILKVGWQPSEICIGLNANNVNGLDVWRDLFLEDLKKRFTPTNSLRMAALKNAAQSLDHGKGYVINGYAWLMQELFDENQT